MEQIPDIRHTMNQPSTLDLSDRTITKLYDFTKMDNLDEFTTRYIWPREKIINDEKQWYVDPDSGMPSPFILSDEGLSIQAIPTPDRWLSEAHEQPYLSGLLTTRDNGHSQLFGYWEIEAKLPNARGAWPAFWLLPTFKQWPSGIAVLSEIDIMEAVGDAKDGIYHASYHSNETGSLVSSGIGIPTDAELTSSYNRYGLSWEEDYLIWYCNGEEVRRAKTPEDMKTEPRHMLLNLAVGGWGGTVDPYDYPASFDIRYVAVYSTSKKKAEPLKDWGWIAHGTHGVDGDAVFRLIDGRIVTERDINLVTEYLIQSASPLRL